MGWVDGGGFGFGYYWGMPSLESLDNAANRREVILSLIAGSHANRGFPPSVAELAEATDVSTRMIRKDLDALVKEGRLERTPRNARSMRVVN